MTAKKQGGRARVSVVQSDVVRCKSLRTCVHMVCGRECCFGCAFFNGNFNEELVVVNPKRMGVVYCCLIDKNPQDRDRVLISMSNCQRRLPL